MPKKRTAIPAATRAAVLKQFRHRCAFCGGDNPHLHHIDDDPTNHDELNLIPLCPNCHLIDQHDPTSAFETERLRLFRRYRDPMILRPQFQPVFARLRFLFDVEVNEDPADGIREAIEELTTFIASFRMGEFYSGRIRDVLGSKPQAEVWFIGGRSDLEQERRWRLKNHDFRAGVVANQDAAIDLLIEQLRYQDWPSPQS